MSRQKGSLISMEGMILNANKTLTYALDPGLRGIPKGYFMTCAGICILNTVQAGFMFSGHVGTGIFLKHNVDGSWSSPVACGITGVGFGFVIGANLKEVIIFMADDASVQTFFSKGVKLGAQSGITIGLGRELESAIEASASGMGAIISIAYTKGVFAGATMEGAMIAPRLGANEAFYGSGNGKPEEIIEGRTPFPVDKVTMMDEVKAKLGKLALGMSEGIGEAERVKAEQAAVAAHKASESVKTRATDIMDVDAEAEAAKGN